MAAGLCILDELTAILGAENISFDEDECRLFSQDVFTQSDHISLAILRPGNKDELAAATKIAVEAGYALFPRGGGMSYTSGYLPSEAVALSIDFSRMDKVIEINNDDMYVTVEAGCRWVDLHEALAGTGLRAAFWGTLSGIHATVGGSMSQNSIFFGSGHYGTAADTVLGFQIVTADGTILTTGSAAQPNSNAFQRHYGPDLTGLFTCDSGALGLKATITLKLMREPAHKRYASFSFENYEAMFTAVSEVSRRGLASESFGFDPYLQAQRMRRQSLSQDVKALKNVMKSSGSAIKAIKEGAKLALAGRGYMDNVLYAHNFIVENSSAAAADEALHEIGDICKNHGGQEIENSIPKIIAANPFMPLNNMVGPEGERWVPVHGLLPHSKAIAAMDAIEGLFDQYSDEIEKHEIGVGYLFTTVSNSTFVIEPGFFWRDALMDIHRETVEEKVLKNFKDFGEQPEAQAMVRKIRAELIEILQAHGAVHLQIGKSYPYAEGIDPTTFALVKSLKKTLDPTGKINPGALGL